MYNSFVVIAVVKLAMRMGCLVYRKQFYAWFLGNLLYKAEKPSLRPSLRPHFFGRVDLSRRCADRRQTCPKRNAGLLG